MTDALHAAEAGPVPVEALAWFRAKGLRPGFSYLDVWREEHAYAFTAAKVMREDVLAAMRDEIARALEEGLTYEQFRRLIEQRLVSLGWWGKQPVRDPVTGRVVEVDVPSRLHRIFETNMRTARAAGQWHRIERTRRTHPYLVYLLGPSREHRPEHVEWAGTVLPVDHPWWDTHFPPNGWGCKCWVRQISERTLERLRTTGVRQLDGSVIPIQERPPVVRTYVHVNPRTGVTSRVPEGIDPGWDYNFGQVRPAADGSPTPPNPTAPTWTPEETLRGIRGFGGNPTDARTHEALRRLFGSSVDPESINRMVEPPAGFRVKTVTVSFWQENDAAVMKLLADIQDDHGEHAATIQRTITRHPNGKLEAHHDYFVVEDEVQGTGLGSHILRQQMRSYDEWGVHEITVDAAWAGRYVWPRMGFDFDDETMNYLRKLYAKFLVSYAGLTESEAQEQAQTINDAYELAHHDLDPSIRITVGYGPGGAEVPGVLYAPPPPRARSSPRRESVRSVPTGRAFLLAARPAGPGLLGGGRVILTRDSQGRASKSRERYIRAIGYNDGT